MCCKKKRYVSVSEKNIRARLVSQKKNVCRQVGRRKKFLHPKYSPPPVISNGPSLKSYAESKV